MRTLARGLRDQARELRGIAAGEDLEGRYADALRDSAADLEVRLRQTAERYEHVHGHLAGWAGELEDLQAASVALLHRARPPAPEDVLPLLRRSLARLTETRDTRAAFYAARINHACDDVIRDSVWERMENEAELILEDESVEALLETAGWVTTAVGLAALFFTPAGWIVDLALDLTIMLAAKDVLALSVGEGSWFDIGMDTVGLLTMGAGMQAAEELARIHSATKLAAEAAAEERATSIALGEERSDLDRTYRVTNRRSESRAAKAAARRLRAGIVNRAGLSGRAARQAEHALPMAEASPLEALPFGGDRETANACKDIDRMRAVYADSHAVQTASRNAGVWRGASKASFLVGAGTDGIDKGLSKSDLLSFKAWSGRYEDFKGQFKVTIGSGW